MTVNGFKKKIYNTLENEFRDGFVVIGVAKDGFLVGVSTDVEELKVLLNKRELWAVIADGSNYGNLSFIIEEERECSDLEILPDANPIDYAFKDLLNVTGIDVNKAKSYIEYSNEFVTRLSKILGSGVEINRIGYGEKADKRLPEFKCLSMYRKSFNLFVTGSQMALVTSAGAVKIHNSKVDIDIDDLKLLLYRLTGVDKKRIRTVLEF